MRKLRVKKGFWIRTVSAILVLGSIYGLVIALPRYIAHRKNVPHKDLKVFRAVVNQYYLAIEDLGSPDGKDVAVAQYLSDSRSSMKQSQAALTEALKKPPKDLSAATLKDIKQQVQQETDVLADYDARFTILSKALGYNPDYDLSLSNTDSSNLAGRGNAANTALKKLADTGTWSLDSPNSSGVSVGTANNSFSLDNDTVQSLQDNYTCFANFAQQVTDKNTTGATATKRQCVTGYTKLRQQLTAALLAPLRSGDGKAVLDGLKTDLANIDKTLQGR